MNQLSKTAQSVQNALSEHNLDFKVLELDASTRTADDASSTIGCQVAQIVKSLVFCVKRTLQPILVLASGVNRVNEKAIKTILGEKIIKPDANFVKQITGFAIGGIPPIGHKQKIVTFIDKDLLKFSQLWAAAGTPNAVFCLNSADLKKITDGKVISIK